MSGPTKRRSLIAGAIDSIGAAQLPVKPDAHALDDTHNPRTLASPAFLERRGAKFDEIARAVKKPTIRLKASECSIWPGNARDYSALTVEFCQTLIDSIKKENGNREPVVVRRTPEKDQPYELIVGTRRHFSVSWLNKNDHPEIDLVARIETLDDEGAFRLADLENRERADVTALERARNYAHALVTYYDSNIARMASRLAMNRHTLYSQVQLAELPDQIVDAFHSPADLKVRHGGQLISLLRSPSTRQLMIDEAVAIALEQAKRASAFAKPLDGNTVVGRLVRAASGKSGKSHSEKAQLVTPAGKNVGSILKNSKSLGLTININPETSANVDEILEALRTVISQAHFSK